ncbi:MAG TPA: glycosyltransferase, partial [Anaerolineae bacterium]
DWLAASDLLISKAGPGTLAEAACLGVPVLVTGYIPGQEEGNIAWIEQNGAGAYVRKPAAVAEFVTDWLQPGNPTLARMAASAAEVARPQAALEIAHQALALWHNANKVLAA